jgi:hypothetical protein
MGLLAETDGGEHRSGMLGTRALLGATAIVVAVSGLADDNDILSKQDATLLFTYSQSRWNANVREAVRVGVAKATVSSDGTLTQFVSRESWILGVAPVYALGRLQEPIALQVTSGYRATHPLTTSFLADRSLADRVCVRTQDELKEEFTVNCEHEKVSDGFMFVFHILKAGEK